MLDFLPIRKSRGFFYETPNILMFAMALVGPANRRVIVTRDPAAADGQRDTRLGQMDRNELAQQPVGRSPKLERALFNTERTDQAYSDLGKGKP